ncbi:Karyopherin Kap123 [Taphrina deformans PYCC 5710]|uniref:Karyopherin Kap123 n=1 Tax=Taphrina deformans (strain PYCC 5710 / ATCC 11124 / CBS 356.35 / IMI 108563 / JCM 9778 / NBRC 8474) TaxID=1097556 RepID=R4X9V3_TAPDE|nr:Karyopherin Kap123 [Taphrina deformans PYCC 5710]|eukprot:CCG82267.1 Karyopherin Kap123 [Taphrina deformans PYCC 5710]
MEQLEGLLNEIAQPDSQRIAAATKALKETYYNNPACLPSLIQVMQQSQSVQIRQLAAVEARKQATAHWASLDETTRLNIRNSLLQSTLSEQQKLVRHASARVIANIARIDLPDGKWQDLPNFLVQAATSRSVGDRVVGIYILYTLFETLDSLFANKMQELFNLFTTTIQDPESSEVRATTLLAIGRMAEIIDSEDKQSVKAFRNVLPSMVKVLQETVTNDDSENAKQAFETFQTLLILEPHLLSKNIPDILQFMIQLGSTTSVDDDYRVMALSWVMTCIRYRRNKIKSLKLGPQLVQAMLKIGSEEDSEAQDEDCPSRLAYRCIDTLSTSLPPSHVYEPLLQSAQGMLQSSFNGDRKSALICMGVGMEGAVDYVSQKFELILPAIIHGLEDQDAIVQRAALLALGQMADELPTEIAEHHKQLLPLVFNLMHSQGDKVGKSATNALEALLEGLEKEDILTYLPRLMSAFFAILHGNEGDLEVRTTVVAAIGSAAHSAEEAFAPYFEDTMTLLLPCLNLTNTTEEMEFRGVVTDTMGAIAGAVGKSRFSPYTQHVSQAAYEGLQLNQPRLRECGFVFFSVLARVLEQDFSPYIGMIVPALLKSLQQDEMGSDANENGDVAGDLVAQAEQFGNVEDINLTGIEGDDDDDDEEGLMKSLGFNSAVAMEKEIAADALGEVFAHVKQDFVPFLELSCTELIKCLDHFYEGVRKSAVGSLFRVVATLYNMSNPQQWIPGVPASIPLHEEVQKYTAIVRQSVFEITPSEDEKLVLTEVLRNYAETVKLCGPAVLGSQEDLNKLCDLILLVLQKQHPCQIGDEGGAFGQDDAEEDIIEADDDDSAEYDAMLIDAANDMIIALAFALGGQFQQPFGQFLPLITKFYTSKATTERASAVACLGEVAGGLKGDITSFTEPIFHVVMQGLVDEDKEVRSNSAYATGLLCEFTKMDLSTSYMTILQKLQPFFAGQNHRLAKDNAIGCTSRMIIARPDSVPLSQVLPVLVSNLPLTDDYAENQPVYKMICQLYRANNQDILNLTEQLVPVFVAVLAGDKDQLKDATRGDLQALCSALNAQFPGTGLQQIVSN